MGGEEEGRGDLEGVKGGGSGSKFGEDEGVGLEAGFEDEGGGL